MQPNYFVEAESDIQHTLENVSVVFSRLIIEPPLPPSIEPVGAQQCMRRKKNLYYST